MDEDGYIEMDSQGQYKLPPRRFNEKLQRFRARHPKQVAIGQKIVGYTKQPHPVLKKMGSGIMDYLANAGRNMEAREKNTDFMAGFKNHEQEEVMNHKKKRRDTWEW